MQNKLLRFRAPFWAEQRRRILAMRPNNTTDVSTWKIRLISISFWIEIVNTFEKYFGEYFGILLILLLIIVFKIASFAAEVLDKTDNFPNFYG